MRFCDYCGDQIDGEAEAIAIGHDAGYLRSCTADEWLHYHSGECISTVREMLENMAKWANLEDGAGLQWQLVEAPKAPKAPPQYAIPDVRKLAAAANGASERPGYTDFDGAEIPTRAAERFRWKWQVNTLEELAERSEFEILQLDGVGPMAVRKLAEAMVDRDLAFREAPSAEEVGRRLRMLRMGYGMSRDDVVDAIEPWDKHGRRNLGEGEVGAWETGSRVPTPERLERVAELFKVSVDSLVRQSVEEFIRVFRQPDFFTAEDQEVEDSPPAREPRLRELRRAMELTQFEVAQRIDGKTRKRVLQATVSQWERGRTPIPEDAQEALAKVFGVSVDHLLNRDLEPAS